MANPEEPQDRGGLDIEEIESNEAPRRLRSRPEEITRIDHEEVDESPPPRPRSIRTTPSGGRNSRSIANRMNLEIAILGVVGILLLSNLLMIYQISSINNSLRVMNSNISELIDRSDNILKDLNGLNENLSDFRKSISSIPISSGALSRNSANESISIVNSTDAKSTKASDG
jgi:hypothetical protein